MKIPLLEIGSNGPKKQSTSIAKHDHRQKMKAQKGLKHFAMIKTGSTIPGVKRQYGDFENWFSEGLGITEFLQVDVFNQEELPATEQLSGILITGSPAMVSDRQDWSERTAAWLVGSVGQGVPTLGVCYGHQLLAQALGGLVGPNPNGRQIGTVQVRLLDAAREDRLFGGFPNSFKVQASHSEVVLQAPREAVRLATSPLDNNCAIRFAENAWGIQFHPEFSAPVMSGYIKYRSDDLLEEGLSPRNLSQQVTETTEATTILKAFRKLTQIQE